MYLAGGYTAFSAVYPPAGQISFFDINLFHIGSKENEIACRSGGVTGKSAVDDKIGIGCIEGDDVSIFNDILLRIRSRALKCSSARCPENIDKHSIQRWVIDPADIGCPNCA